MKERILVVEDDLVNGLFAIHEFVSDPNVEDFFCASNFEDGLRIIKENNPTVALLDLRIPRVQGGSPQYIGYELGDDCKRRGIPYVYVTADKNIHIKKEFGERKLETLTTIHEIEKSGKVWRAAYAKLSEVYGRK